jgi:hypothetical protein
LREARERVLTERREALEVAAERARSRARGTAQPLVGARARPPVRDDVEYEVVPLPSASEFLGSSLGGGCDH